MVIQRSNDALLINPPTGDLYHLSTHGSDWLWAVTAVYCLSLVLVVGMMFFFAPKGEKIFHYLFIISLFVGSVAYFTMASDLGSTPILTADNAAGTREIFYARYINWFCGWPPVILALGLLSGVSWSTMIFNIALSWIWVCTYLSGALVRTNYKWGFFVFGTVAYFLLAASLISFGLVTAKRVGSIRHYTLLSGWLVFLWLLYPIAWGLDDGGNKIQVTSGFVFFGVLDVLMVPVLAWAFLALSTTWDYRALNIYFTQYGRVAQGGEFPERERDHEKAAEAPAAAAADPMVAPEQAV